MTISMYGINVIIGLGSVLLHVLLIGASFPVGSANAQEYGWQTSAVCHPCVPTVLAIGDSMHMVIAARLDHEPRLFYSKDGGSTWHLSPQMATRYLTPSDFQFFSFFPPETFYLFDQLHLFVTTDGGENWEVRSPMPGTRVARMFSPSFGYRTYRPAASLYFRESRDSGVFWDPVREWAGVQHIHFSDSERFYATGTGMLLRSWDKGVSWDTVRPVDTALRPAYRHYQFTKDTNRFYVVGGQRDSSSFLRTLDGGTTWKDFAPLTYSRVYRLAEQTPDSLWLLVGRKGNANFEPKVSLHNGASVGYFADTLLYTTDAGSTWKEDHTFAGDTITELQFTSPTNGIVLSVRDSTIKFSRYVPASASVKSSYRYDGRGMYIHPNPVSDELKFYPRLGGKCVLRILDVLGRAVHEAPIDFVHAQWSTVRVPDSLPDGIYFLELQRGDARAGQRFLIQR